jgi:hypothetical protein
METEQPKKKKTMFSAPETSETESYRPRIERRLTLRRLIDGNEEIWVRNKSAEATKRRVACNVVFQVGHGDMTDTVLIPPGNDPVCITDQVDPESLKSCRDLFKLVKSGTLELLDPNKAEEYYKHNIERKKIVEQKINNMLNASKIDPTKPKRKFDLNRPDPDQLRKDAGHVLVMNPRVTDICLKARHAAITEGTAMESLMEQEAVFQQQDFEYLSTNGVFPGVKRWAKQKLQKFEAQE